MNCVVKLEGIGLERDGICGLREAKLAMNVHKAATLILDPSVTEGKAGN